LSNVRCLVLDLDIGRISLSREGEPGVQVEARGFAPPFSNCRTEWSVSGPDRVLCIRRRGFFFELNVSVDVVLPANFNGDLLVQCRRGEVDIRNVPGDGRTFAQIGSGRITWRGGDTSQRVLLRNHGGDVQIPVGDGSRELMVEAPKGPVRLPLLFQEGNGFMPNRKGEQTMRYGQWNGSTAVFIDARSIHFNDPEPK
jgi:hypothetical protein